MQNTQKTLVPKMGSFLDLQDPIKNPKTNNNTYLVTFLAMSVIAWLYAVGFIGAIYENNPIG
jgi:hypothetical protein